MAQGAIANQERRLKLLPLNTSQTFVAGAAVILSSGKVSTAAATPTTILGFAAEDAANTTLDLNPNEVLVAVAHPGATFIMELHNADSGQVAADAANIGTAYGIRSVSGVWVVDETDTTNDCVKVVDIVEGPTNGPGLALVEVEVITPMGG